MDYPATGSDGWGQLLCLDASLKGSSSERFLTLSKKYDLPDLFC
jgi:hypothetical protein